MEIIPTVIAYIAISMYGSKLLGDFVFERIYPHIKGKTFSDRLPSFLFATILFFTLSISWNYKWSEILFGQG